MLLNVWWNPTVDDVICVGNPTYPDDGQTTEKDSTGVNPIRKQISLTLAQAQIKAILVLEYRVCTTNPDDFENRQYEKS